uniref:AAA+ ATPase domain-containing protein n=1 Tax=Globodera rostochiensis TaxID=31243 RepID=A0A914IAS3_GLORO
MIYLKIYLKFFLAASRLFLVKSQVLRKEMEFISNNNLPWVEKYRPKFLDDLVSQEEIVKTISKLIDEDKLPHLLFYGPPGTGKTSTILAAARKIFSPKNMQSRVLELNASDERGIGVVREKIINFTSSQGLHDMTSSKGKRIKLVILDEADAMTKDAQNALRRIIEKYTDSTRFCIICNYLSRIIPALQSRCTRFRFAPLSQKEVLPRLNHIIEKEHLHAVTDEAKNALFKLSKGDMRRIINILQSTALSAPAEIDEDSDIFRVLLDNSIEIAYKKLSNLRLSHGVALADLLEELVELLRPLDLPDELSSKRVN